MRTRTFRSSFTFPFQHFLNSEYVTIGMPGWNWIDQPVFLGKALLNMFKRQQQKRSSSHIK